MTSLQLTKRERILNALHRREVDRMPWAPLIDDYFISSLPLQNIHMDIIEAMRYIGNDIMERHVCMPFTHTSNMEIRRETSADGTYYRTYYDTPVGSLYEEHKNSGQTGFMTHHMIETLEDMQIYQYIAEHMTYTDNIKGFSERDAFIGDDGIATTSGPPSPIQCLLQGMAGVENTVYLMADYPDEMDELLQTMHECNLRNYKILAEYPTEVIIDYEDTSSTVLSRSMFTDYCAPAINDYADILHKSGKLFITHMCGKLNAFKNEIGCGRQDGVDSICPPNTGDLYLWEARKTWGDNKVLIGGIDPPHLSRITPEECEKLVLEINEKLTDKRGFILSTGDAVPFGTPIENLIAITKLVEKLKF